MKPGSPEIAPGQPAPHVTNDTDRLFSRIVAMGGMAEVEFAKLVEKRSHDPAVERFASRMIEDHVKANEQLASLAKAGDIPLPKSLDPEHEATRSKLEKLTGKEFDQAYLQGQVVDHQKTAQLLEHEIGSGQDPALKTFASETLPTVLDHLQMARDIQMQLRGES